MSVFNYTRPGLRLFASVMTLAAALLLNACGKDGGGFDTGVTIPQNVVAYAGSGIVTLTWDAVDDADSYTVYWSKDPNVNDRDDVLLPGAATNIAHTGLTNGQTYYYRVSSTVNGNESRLSDEQSATPTAWVKSSNYSATQPFNALQWSGSVFVVAGESDTLLSSADGDDWTSRNPPGSYDLNGLMWSEAKTLFVAVGDAGAVVYSDDGINWVDDSGDTANNLFAAVSSGSQFVTVGESETILRTLDPQSFPWSVPTGSVPGLSKTIDAIAWNGTLFAAVGQDGFIATSPDGDTWTLQTSPFTDELRAVVWASDQFVAVGDGGVIATSPDGISWTEQDSGVISSLNGLFHDGALYLAVGDGGVILSSVDGITWTQESTSGDDLYAVTGDGSQNVVAGGVVGNGVIYTRPR